ncbi:hypothetical protein FDB51_06145 [Clostridium botulinum]|uniref:SIR2-like domain-containing protein n=2 Tax=Clostridium botulinum TaxID=1491 RepID=A0A846JNP9_CLOBO|nr:hypothetical protein [Clostridium botulinum]
MKFKEKIKDIRQAKENNRLVIFVGAGVSKNSNVPTWEELIKVFADKLQYNNCKKCNFKNKIKCGDKCSEKYNFSQDEFLKIPQYYYDMDNSKDKQKYKNIIKDTLGIQAKSNEIDEIILELLPDHIITTNYDTLIENSNNPNTRLYKNIYKDEDLLKQNNSHYIIKMHGDINDLNSIVLKESDYISYSQKHVLMETKIKSLLIDHTFLFVGYSLNDYNLKLILGWIDYLAKENNVFEERPKNYIIQIDNKSTEKYVESYLESSNVYVINTNDLPQQVNNKNKDINLGYYGKKVYSCLDYILDSSNDFLVEPLVDVLLEKFKIFNDFKRISYEDLISFYSFGRTKLNGYMMEFFDEYEYNKIKKIVTSNEIKELEIKKILRKAVIVYIYFIINHKVDHVKIIIDDEDDINQELFSLYLDNNYSEILKKTSLSKDYKLRIYYYYLIKHDDIIKNNDYKDMLIQMKNTLLNNNSIYDLIVYNLDNIAYKISKYENVDKDWKKIEQIINQLSEREQKAYKFMKKINFGIKDNLLSQQVLFEKLEATYLNKDGSTYWGKPLVNLLELQGYVYDYYFYFKFNNLTLDYFSNPNKYCTYYLQAIICTYTPNKNRKSDMFLGRGTKLQEYEINEYDLDLFIKYTNSKDLKNWLNTYNVKELKLDEDINTEQILIKFKNYCISLIEFKNIFMYNQLHCFILILSKLSLNIEEKKVILIEMSNVIEKCLDKFNGLIVKILDSVLLICREFINDNIAEFNRILVNLLDCNVIKEAKARDTINELEKIIDLLCKYKDNNVFKKIDLIFESNIEDKFDILFIIRKNFSNNQKKRYRNMLISSDLQCVKNNQIFWLVYEELLFSDENIKDKYIKTIEKEIEERVKQPNKRTFPDHIEEAIESCIILNLIGKMDDISFLKKYQQYSEFIEFIFNSDNFDYSKINIKNYMWKNLITSKKYLNIILKHKRDLNIDKLKQAIENGYATEDEKKFLYRYLTSDEELWKL